VYALKFWSYIHPEVHFWSGDCHFHFGVVGVAVGISSLGGVGLKITPGVIYLRYWERNFIFAHETKVNDVRNSWVLCATNQFEKVWDLQKNTHQAEKSFKVIISLITIPGAGLSSWGPVTNINWGTVFPRTPWFLPTPIPHLDYLSFKVKWTFVTLIISQFLRGVTWQKLRKYIHIYRSNAQNADVLFFGDTVHFQWC